MMPLDLLSKKESKKSYGMSNRINELFLFDILVAIVKIEQVSSDFEYAEQLKHHFMAWDSVIREFEIIGEAANILIKNKMLTQENQIVVDFRNILIHHYFGIDAEEVWDVIHNDLKSFKFVILDAIKKIEATLKEELLGDIIDENNHLNFIVQVLNQLKEEC